MGNYENGRNGGSLPLYIREVFHSAVEGFVYWHFYTAPESPELTVCLDDEHGEITLSQVCGLVWNCTNYLPTELMLRIEWITGEQMRGSTYACAARRLLRLINWHKGLKAVRPRGSPKANKTEMGKRRLTPEEGLQGLAYLFGKDPVSE